MITEVRTVELENGNKINFTCGPKHPYWSISFEKGGIPQELSGVFTDYEKAYNAAVRYVEKRHTRNRTTVKTDK